MEMCPTLGDFYIFFSRMFWETWQTQVIKVIFQVISINDQVCTSKYFTDYLKSK